MMKDTISSWEVPKIKVYKATKRHRLPGFSYGRKCKGCGKDIKSFTYYAVVHGLKHPFIMNEDSSECVDWLGEYSYCSEECFRIEKTLSEL